MTGTKRSGDVSCLRIHRSKRWPSIPDITTSEITQSIPPLPACFNVPERIKSISIAFLPSAAK